MPSKRWTCPSVKTLFTGLYHRAGIRTLRGQGGSRNQELGRLAVAVVDGRAHGKGAYSRGKAKKVCLVSGAAATLTWKSEVAKVMPKRSRKRA